MNATVEKIKTGDKFAELFDRLHTQLPGNASIQSIRKNAIAAFLKQGIPTRKNEEYKYSLPEKLFKTNYSLATKLPSLQITADDSKTFDISGITQNKIVLINGFYSQQLSSVNNLTKGVIVSDISTSFEKHAAHIEKHFAKYANVDADPFIALNSALNANGLFIFVPENTVVEQPIHIINIITANELSLIQPRNLFIIEKNAEIKIIESLDAYKLSTNVVVNMVTEISVAEQSKVQYYKLQNDCEKIAQINTTQVYQLENSHFDTNTVTLNGDWVRNNLNIVVDAENCETHLNGLFISKNNQHIDNHTLVDHQKPNCQSNQLYKGVLSGKSTGVFNGKIYVRRDAQKINAYQSSKNILLSDDATINTKPELEIYADDVKCSHGSSTGQLNEDALFYLRARGLSTDSAKRMLLYAFASDAINTIRIDVLKEHIDKLIEKQLIQ
ncbi:MAG: Fe-S cluster assembly protein SufD [Bacteroidia bacterium]|nr:Fe-S cluster assembly protein SufD [Bacteroidia bacterium]